MQRALAPEGTNMSVCTLISAGRRFEGLLQGEETTVKTDLIKSWGGHCMSTSGIRVWPSVRHSGSFSVHWDHSPCCWENIELASVV